MKNSVYCQPRSDQCYVQYLGHWCFLHQNPHSVPCLDSDDDSTDSQQDSPQPSAPPTDNDTDTARSNGEDAALLLDDFDID